MTEAAPTRYHVLAIRRRFQHARKTISVDIYRFFPERSDAS
jgi:hypothetical protein